jgi:hypothetical protein
MKKKIGEIKKLVNYHFNPQGITISVNYDDGFITLIPEQKRIDFNWGRTLTALRETFHSPIYFWSDTMVVNDDNFETPIINFRLH